MKTILTTKVLTIEMNNQSVAIQKNHLRLIQLLIAFLSLFLGNQLLAQEANSRSIPLDTLYLSNKQKFSGQVRKFGGFRIKILSLENGNSKKMTYHYAYRNVDSVTSNTFDKRGRTFEQVIKKGQLNSRMAIGFQTINIGLAAFIDIPIKETENINFRLNMGGVSFFNPYQNFSHNSEAYYYNIYEQNIFGSNYIRGARVETDYTRAHINPGKYTARPGFFFDFEPRGYLTGRKCAVKPYLGLLLGINKTAFFTTSYKETESKTTSQSEGNRTTIYQYFDIEAKGTTTEKLGTHIGYTAGTEFYFGERLAIGLGYRYMLVNNSINQPRHLYQRFDKDQNLKTETNWDFKPQHLSSHLITLEIKYLLNTHGFFSNKVNFD